MMKKTMMKKTMMKSLLAVTAMSCMLGMSAFAEETTNAEAAAAETKADEAGIFTDAEEFPNMPVKTVSENGLMTIYLPDASWKQVPDEDCCIAYSNGKDYILYDHYFMNDEMPEIKLAPKGYFSYQAFECDGDVVNVFTGFATDEETFSFMKVAMTNAEVDTSKIDRSEKHDIVVSEFSIQDTNYTGYVTASELNVRPQQSGEGTPLGCLLYGTPIEVTGKVLRNGNPIGWLRVNYNGQNGYVAEQFVSTTKPAEKITVVRTYGAFNNITGEGVDIILYSDGSYKDNTGKSYYLIGDETWQDANGNTFITSLPAPFIDHYITCYKDDGTMIDLRVMSDDSILDENNDQYMGCGEGAYQNQRTDEIVYDHYVEPKPYIVRTFTVCSDDTGIYCELNEYSNGEVLDNIGDQYMSFSEGHWQNQITNENFTEEP